MFKRVWRWLIPLAVVIVLLTASTPAPDRNEQERAKILEENGYLTRAFYQSDWDNVRPSDWPRISINYDRMYVPEGDKTPSGVDGPCWYMFYQFYEEHGKPFHVTGMEMAVFYYDYDQPYMVYGSLEETAAYWGTDTLEPNGAYAMTHYVEWSKQLESLGISIIGEDDQGNQMEFHNYIPLKQPESDAEKELLSFFPAALTISV